MIRYQISSLVTISLLALASACSSEVASQSRSDIHIADTEVFPESLDVAEDGTVYIGSVKGNVYRALPGESQAQPWIRHSETNGILTLLGVRVDEAANTLWLCSAPNFFGPERSEGLSSLIAFNLDSGDFQARYPLPPPAAVCNDIAVDDAGTVWLTDTPNGRIFTLEAGDDSLTLYLQDDALAGIDGIDFSADGTLYVNNVQSNEVLRVDRDRQGNFVALQSLTLSHELGGPDGMRLIDGERFVQAEGTIGRVGILDIEGDTAELTVLSDEFISTPGATVINDTVYVLESNIGYLLDPALQGEEPGAFIVYALPLPESD